MKIRDLIIALLIIGMVISTGTLVVFATSGIGDIKDTTSQASSGELLDIASKNLEDVAISIRDSLDNQMQNQYDMVKTWAKAPTLLEVAKKAQDYSLEELYEMWSAEATREYSDKFEAIGDGNPDNDLSPSASKFLSELSLSVNYPEIFITDYRGYTVASSAATEDFDQGADDWTIFLTNGEPVYKKANPAEGGEDWYRTVNDSKDCFYVSDVIWNESTGSWGIEIATQLRDPATDEYLGQIKAVFDYGMFIDQFVNVEEFDVYEIKVISFDGMVVATSLADKSKVNNYDVNIRDDDVFWTALATSHGNRSEAYLDENGESVYAGFARSSDSNRHIVMVTKKAEDIAAPIDAFIGTLQSDIGDKSSSLQRNMIIIGAVVAVVIIVLAALIMRAKVSIPLKKLTDVSEKLSKGEIEGLEIDIKGKDEISSFGESFKGVLAAFNFLKDEAEKKQ